jgi:hypothetical protein
MWMSVADGIPWLKLGSAKKPGVGNCKRLSDGVSLMMGGE